MKKIVKMPPSNFIVVVSNTVSPIKNIFWICLRSCPQKLLLFLFKNLRLYYWIILSRKKLTYNPDYVLK